jgi:phosphate transport system substrate-binding protein
MRKTFALVAVATAALVGAAEAREQIRVVGSSTVFPFTSTAAENFARTTDFKSPVVEATGTGGGMKLFCEGVGNSTPDMTGASRAMKSGELEMCQTNGVTEVVQLKIGSDGIALAHSNDSPSFNVSRVQLWLALAPVVPVNGKLVANPHNTWADLDPSLPDIDIEVMGPPPSSGTRDAWIELVMEEGCQAFPEVIAADNVKELCTTFREDGVFIEAVENDNLVVQKLQASPGIRGILGFSYLDQNFDVLKGNPIEGIEPDFDAIADGSYPVARPLFVYLKSAHVGAIPGLAEFVTELTSENALGDDGYLIDKGLIPLPSDDRDVLRKTAAELTPLGG